MPVDAEIFVEREDWRHPLALSVAFHALLFGSMILYSVVSGLGSSESWGGTGYGGGAMSATLVNSVPLPRPAVETENVLANESKGVSQSLPKAKEEPAPEAIPIPARNVKPTREAKVHTPTREAARAAVEPPTNVVPFGQGGPVSGPYGNFSAGGTKGGLALSGGGGDFGSRYAWYVDVVRRKLTDNWYKYEVDPTISTARRVYITFEITRDGRPRNVQIEQSSGVPSLDISAVRAIQRIDTFGSLPPDYSGGSVNVEFWFDYRH